MELQQIVQVISGGGVIAFAMLVWLSLRDFRVELEKHRDEEVEARKAITEVEKTLAMLLERMRWTDSGPILRPLPRPSTDEER